MVRPIFWACAAALFLAAPAGAAAELCTTQQHQQKPGQPPSGKPDQPGDHASQPQRPKWWIDPKLRAELLINDQQSAAVELIWQKSTPALRDARAKLAKAEDVLTELTRDDAADEAKVVAQIELVEQLRADANKRRIVMIYRMNKLLTVDQRAKVKALYERSSPGRRDSSR